MECKWSETTSPGYNDCSFTNRSYWSICYKTGYFVIIIVRRYKLANIDSFSHFSTQPSDCIILSQKGILESQNLEKPSYIKCCSQERKTEIRSFSIHTEGSPVSSLNCNRQQIPSLEAHCTLLLAPMQEGGWAGWACQGRWPPVWNCNWSQVI